ncbi:transcriptional regulator [Sinomicrobium weinanense]|uniref:Transcriptional regulator n=1 Tax=Sinomicrobium weinanense TaxID=2842200 RepID=A0A926JSR3_9FLAO|nr:transcriptional regulator [Sinomicrobium weinanense]MBC9796696.1 transcriptional regulator [Sinomicrobium weinanense]MBU3123029.1 SatD family protein [Sinomicrobium weinanense]
MTSVITGDIINSREAASPVQWLSTLKESLSLVSAAPKYWEVFRGDSFQVEVQDYYNAFQAAVYIKASLKTIKDLDVRMAIGIGSKTHEASTISESNGEAFIFSGELFETLKKEKKNLAIKTGVHRIDEELNLYFKLGLIAMDNWTPNSAEIVKLTIENPKLSQQEVGKLINIKQNTVSERQKRAYLDEVMALDRMYRHKIDHIEHAPAR